MLESKKGLMDDLRLSVFMSAKAQALRGDTSIMLMHGGKLHGRSIWDWWNLFDNVGIRLESVLTLLAHKEIGPDWKVEYSEWSNFFASSRCYYLVKESSRR